MIKKQQSKAIFKPFTQLARSLLTKRTDQPSVFSHSSKSLSKDIGIQGVRIIGSFGTVAFILQKVSKCVALP